MKAIQDSWRRTLARRLDSIRTQFDLPLISSGDQHTLEDRWMLILQSGVGITDGDMRVAYRLYCHEITGRDTKCLTP